MNASYKRYWEPNIFTTLGLSLSVGALVTTVTYPLEFVKRIIQLRSEGVGIRTNIVQEMGVSGSRIFRQMHELGEGLGGLYHGFQAHLFGRLGYLAIRNTLYKIVYDQIKPIKPSNDLTIREKMILSGTVGGIAAFLTSPFELVSVRQSLDTQIPKAWRRNYDASPMKAVQSLKSNGECIWKGSGLNVTRHVLLNASLTGPYDYVHEKLWIIFGDYGHVKPIAVALSALVGSIVTLPFDNFMTKWMQRHSDPTRNRVNAPSLGQFIGKCIEVEGHMFSPWVGFYTYYTKMLIFTALTVAITDSVTTALKRREKSLLSWQI